MNRGSDSKRALAPDVGPVNPPEIELVDVERTFVTEGGVRVDALQGISLTIGAGEFIAIRGPSGCGKSTLLHILGCLDRPSRGIYRIAGQDVERFSVNDLAWLRRQSFGFVFQSYNLVASATAIENVELPAVYAGISPVMRRRRAVRLLTFLGLGERFFHRPSHLSGGEQQRVSIARALMNGGRIILADEPTGALDSQTSGEIIDLLAGLAKQGHTVIVVTHDPKVAMQADRELEMLDGRIVNDSGQARAEADRQVTAKVDTSFPVADHRAAASIGDVFEAVRMALRSLRANTFRTCLTLLGVVIGVAAFVAMLAVGEGAKRQLAGEIDSLGANRISIWADTRSYPGAKLTFEDAQAVAERVNNVKAVLPSISGTRTLRVGNRDHVTTILATTAQFPFVRNWPIASGIFFNDTDSDAMNAVAVVGATVAGKLFPDHEDPLGEYVLINKVPFLVIGTLTRKGAAGFESRDLDDVVLVPLKTGARRLFGRSSLQTMTVTVENSDLIDQTEAQVHETLIASHGMDDVRIRNSAEMQETMSEAMSTATVILGAIGAIALVVGGIGVMNIMLVSVSERTREIGIRIATGARRGDILVQFLVEAVVVTGVGGLIGLGVGFGIALLLSFIFPEVRVAFTLAPMLIAFGSATIVGLVFGFAPAHSAAGLDPVVALSSD